MHQNEQETMELFQGPVTRARAKEMKERVQDGNDELMALMDRAMNEGHKI